MSYVPHMNLIYRLPQTLLFTRLPLLSQHNIDGAVYPNNPFPSNFFDDGISTYVLHVVKQNTRHVSGMRDLHGPQIERDDCAWL